MSDNQMTELLAYWINERYAIKMRREQGVVRPWSGDPIFQTVRFCNVHREDDAVTQWIRTYWNKPHDDAWKFVVGRMINWPLALDKIRLAPDPFEMRDTLKQYRATGEKVFTSAYTISTCGQQMDKLDYVFSLAGALANAGNPDYESLASTAEELSNVPGLGSFLSAQVVADMKNTEGHPLQKAPDWWTWSAPGPGSLRGLNWYFYSHAMLLGQSGNVRTSNYDEFLLRCVKEVTPLIAEYVPRISAQDFQNCLCEFSKYCKVKFLNGHVRNKYQGV